MRLRRAWASALVAVRLRHAVPLLLATAGIVSICLASAANETTWKAVWIGVASTALAAGLVDASVQIERAAREQAIIRVASQRIARINKSVAFLVRSAYEIDAYGSDLHDQLDALADDHETDATELEYGMGPDRTKGEWWALALQEIDRDMELAVTLGSLTYAAARVERLEQIIRSNWFLIILRTVPPIEKIHGAHVKQAAVELFEVMAYLDFWFARRSGLN